jgi:DNA processing protein
VVEAALLSGSLITARFANEQGREVFALPGSIHSPLAKGCHALIKQGAKLVDSAEDVLEELHLIGAPSTVGDAPALDPGAASLLAQLGFESTDLDTLCARCGMGADVVSALLLKLELQGLIAALPGDQYQRVR